MPRCNHLTKSCVGLLLGTRLGEQQINFIGQELSDSGVEMVDGLLHGLHTHAQVVIFPLQHGVLLEQVAEAF